MTNKTTKIASAEEEELIRGMERAGLPRNDATVYLHLLKLGRDIGATKLALATGIHRQYLYISIERLMSAGLLLSMKNGARHRYKAAPPAALERYARKNFDAAGETAQRLAQISALGNEQDFEMYVGDKQVRDYEEEFMSNLGEDETQYVISGASENFLTYFEDEYEHFAVQGKQKKLRTLYVGGMHEAESLGYAKKMNPLFEYRLLDGMPRGVTSTVVRHNSVVLYSLAKPPLIYVIRSQRISDEYKAYFDVLWKLAKP